MWLFVPGQYLTLGKMSKLKKKIIAESITLMFVRT